MVQFYKWFTDLESAMKSEVSCRGDCSCANVFGHGFFFSFLSWCFLLLGGGEVPALCQQSNGAHGDMWWYTSPGICLFYCSFLDDFMLLINSWILWMKSIFYLFNIPSLSECRWMKLSTSLMSYSCSTKLLLQRLRLFMMLVTDWCDFSFLYSLLNTYSRMSFGLVL